MKLISTFILLTFIFTSCYTEEPIKNYKDGIVHHKGEYYPNGRVFKLEKDGEFLKVYVTKFDYEKYNIGDTIK